MKQLKSFALLSLEHRGLRGHLMATCSSSQGVEEQLSSAVCDNDVWRAVVSRGHITHLGVRYSHQSVLCAIKHSSELPSQPGSARTEGCHGRRSTLCCLFLLQTATCSEKGCVCTAGKFRGIVLNG